MFRKQVLQLIKKELSSILELNSGSKLQKHEAGFFKSLQASTAQLGHKVEKHPKEITKWIPVDLPKRHILPALVSWPNHYFEGIRSKTCYHQITSFLKKCLKVRQKLGTRKKFENLKI